MTLNTWRFAQLAALVLAAWLLDGNPETSEKTKDHLHKAQLAPCQLCTAYVKSFEVAMNKTANGKFEGGDAAWEEKNQGSYAQSEVRLTDMQDDHVCTDVIRGRDQCFHFGSTHDELIEFWWKTLQSTKPFFDWLCIEQLTVCCPNNTYGSQCSSCPGGVENPCSGNGKCKGAGTRKGSGECKCIPAYSGALCDECAVGFYNGAEAEGKTECLPCDKSCLGPCSGPGSTSCEYCREGWFKDESRGCLDIDECFNDIPPCLETHFCANTLGSYQCLDCHKSCAGCTGDGPDFCNACAEGYYLSNGICTDSASWWKWLHTTTARYVTYAGLTVSTFIIFRTHVMVASVIGLAVAVYISIAEYTVNDENEGTGLADFIKSHM